MTVLIGLVTVLSAAAFWYFRLRNVGQAAGELVDGAQRARGAWKRRQFAKKVEGSAISAIDDPATAAAAFLVSLARERGPLTPSAEAAVRREIAGIGVARPEEVYTFARWAAEHAVDPGDLSLKFSKLWMAHLSWEEREELAAMAARVAACDGPPTPEQETALRGLGRRLGLVD